MNDNKQHPLTGVGELLELFLLFAFLWIIFGPGCRVTLNEKTYVIKVELTE